MSQETAMKVYPPYCLYSFDWSQNLPGRVSICMATVVFSMFPMVRQSPINNWNITLHPFHTNICLFLVILNKSNLNNPVWNNSILNKGYEENRLCMTILCMSVLTRTFLVSQLFPWEGKLLKFCASSAAVIQTLLHLSPAESHHVHREVFEVHWDHPVPAGCVCYSLQHPPVLPQWTSSAAQWDNWSGLVFPRHSGSWNTGKREEFPLFMFCRTSVNVTQIMLVPFQKYPSRLTGKVECRDEKVHSRLKKSQFLK